MERLWLYYADLLISVDEQRAIIQSNEWKKPKPAVIFNSPLYDPAIEHTSLNFIKEIRVPIKIVYAGSIAQRNCFEQLFDALNLVNCPLLFDVFGPIRPEFKDTFQKSLIKLKRNKNIKINYKGVLEYQKIVKELPMYDIGLVLYDGKDPNTAMAAPAKLFEYMKAGLGIISTNQPGPRNIIKKGIKPNVNNMFIVQRKFNPPIKRSPGNTQILQSFLNSSHNLISPLFRKNKFRILFVKFKQKILVFTQSKKI